MVAIVVFNLIDCSPFDRYLLKERSDDSVLLMLIIRIMDALGNFGMVIRPNNKTMKALQLL